MELSKKLEAARFELAELRELNSESSKRAKELIAELESIKAEWLQALDALNLQRAKYEKLNHEIRKYRNKALTKTQLFLSKFI